MTAEEENAPLEAVAMENIVNTAVDVDNKEADNEQGDRIELAVKENDVLVESAAKENDVLVESAADNQDVPVESAADNLVEPAFKENDDLIEPEESSPIEEEDPLSNDKLNGNDAAGKPLNDESFDPNLVEINPSVSTGPADIKTMLSILLSNMMVYSKNALFKRSKAKSLSNRANHFIIGRYKDEIVGFIMYRLERNECLIMEFHVSKQYQSRGLGERFLSELSNVLGENVRMVLFVYKENEGAQRFYNSQGFLVDNEYKSKNQMRLHKP